KFRNSALARGVRERGKNRVKPLCHRQRRLPTKVGSLGSPGTSGAGEGAARRLRSPSGNCTPRRQTLKLINPNPFTTRPEITGTFGVVTSTHWIATAVGMGILERGDPVDRKSTRLN